MKTKLFTLAILLTFCLSSFAQYQVTRFLGIPVDGFKKDMIHKLESKGFEYDSANDILNGEFNGTDVNIYIVTNNNKVCRILVCDSHTIDESDIKIRFNKLIRQFKNNERYDSFTDEDQTIPEETDISYEMQVNNKNFDAIFYQKIDYNMVDTLAIREQMKEPLEECFKNKEQELLSGLKEKISDKQLDMLKETMMGQAVKLALSKIQQNMPVWFRISEIMGRYYISMFYDNEYNRADGSDL